MLIVEANVNWGFLLLGLKTSSLIRNREPDQKQWGPSMASGSTEKEAGGSLMASSGFDWP